LFFFGAIPAVRSYSSAQRLFFYSFREQSQSQFSVTVFSFEPEVGRKIEAGSGESQSQFSVAVFSFESEVGRKIEAGSGEMED
jgi:hypothetical protein